MSTTDTIEHARDLMAELLPLGVGQRVELMATEHGCADMIQRGDGLWVGLQMIVYGDDRGSIEDIKDGSVRIAPSEVLTDPDRLEVYLRGWAAAVGDVLEATPFAHLAELAPGDFTSADAHWRVREDATVEQAREVHRRAYLFGHAWPDAVARPASAAMDADTFWAVVDEARAASPADVVAGLHRALAARSPDEIESFRQWLDAYRYAAHRKELWAAAYYIQGGCSDDGFDYVRGWLIAQGRSVYEAAVRDPGSLASHRWPGADRDRPSMSYEAMLSVGERAYELATGRRIAPGSELPHIPGRASWPADRIADYEWTDDTVAALFPALAERWPR